MGSKKTPQPNPDTREARRVMLASNPNLPVGVDDAATLLDVSASTLKFLCREGRAPKGFLVGRRRRFLVKDLLTFAFPTE